MIEEEGGSRGEEQGRDRYGSTDSPVARGRARGQESVNISLHYAAFYPRKIIKIRKKILLKMDITRSAGVRCCVVLIYFK